MAARCPGVSINSVAAAPVRAGTVLAVPAHLAVRVDGGLQACPGTLLIAAFSQASSFQPITAGLRAKNQGVVGAAVPPSRARQQAQTPRTREPRSISLGHAMVSGHVRQSGSTGLHHRRPISQAGRSRAPGRLG